MNALLQERLSDAFLRDIIGHEVRQIENDRGIPVRARVSVIDCGAVVNQFETPSPSTHSDRYGNFLVRVRFKDTIKPERFRFWAQAMTDDIAPETGYSGFSLQGDIKIIDGKCVARLDAIVIRYNARYWEKELRLSTVSDLG